MSEEFREEIDDLEDNINANLNRIIDLEEKEKKIESYKIFLYPKTILNYISNLINLQAKEGRSDQFYPAIYGVISDLFKDKKVNPGNIQPKKIKYNPQISYKNLFKISEIISFQGWSGFNYLENLEKNIDLNKPLILYYGIKNFIITQYYFHIRDKIFVLLSLIMSHRNYNSILHYLYQEDFQQQ